jgi:uncharacterized membrane protein
LKSNPKTDELTEAIIRTIKEKEPQSVRQLATLLREQGYKEKETLEVITSLQSQGVIKLEDVSLKTVYNISDAAWYLLTIAIGTITSVLVFLIPAGFYPWVYMRNILGVLFVLFLPGYTFTRAILRFKKPESADSNSLEVIENIALGFALSLALVSIIALALYYSPVGLNLNTIVVSLFVFTSIFASIGLFRENKVNQRDRPLVKLPSLE